MNSLVVLLLVLSANRALTLHESWFERGQICDVEERLNRGCSTEKSGVHDMAKCVATCGGDISCIGASLDATGKCFHHQLCVSTMACTQPNPEHDYMVRFCVHGTWDRATHSCRCTLGVFGTRCDNYHRNCNWLKGVRNPTGDYHVIIDPLQDRTNLIGVVCYLYPPANYQGILMYSNTGKLDFNRTFDEYENGFHADNQNFWLGLRALHMLSKAGCNKTVIQLDFEGNANAHVKNVEFTLAGKENGYSFYYTRQFSTSINAPSGYYAGNCLGGLKNKPFSTWDNDRDGDSQTNCASRAGSGWWYSGCNNPCNVLGWGLEDYANTPTHQRLSMFGVNVGASPVPITRSKGFYLC